LQLNILFKRRSHRTNRQLFVSTYFCRLDPEPGIDGKLKPVRFMNIGAKLIEKVCYGIHG